MRPWYTLEGFAALPLVFQMLGIAYVALGQRPGWLMLAGANVLWALYNVLQGRPHLLVINAVLLAAYLAAYGLTPWILRRVVR